PGDDDGLSDDEEDGQVPGLAGPDPVVIDGGQGVQGDAGQADRVAIAQPGKAGDDQEEGDQGPVHAGDGAVGSQRWPPYIQGSSGIQLGPSCSYALTGLACSL